MREGVKLWPTESAVEPAAPRLSLIVVVFDMDREAPRTLRSLSPGYQQGIDAADYEIVVVDNGSPAPLPAAVFAGLEGRFSYWRMAEPRPSPAAALNFGARVAAAPTLGLMVDGARLLTPGVARLALAAAAMGPDPMVATLGWHLGPGVQNETVPAGYDREAEDALLESIGWPEDGYRLFEIAALAASSAGGWFLPPAESNCLFVSRAAFAELGGFDERFDSPGGGLANHDFFERAWNRPGATRVVLLGEGSFHQVHGGIATGAAPEANALLWRRWSEQYEAIRGHPLALAGRYDGDGPLYLGRIPPAAWPALRRAAERLGQ